MHATPSNNKMLTLTSLRAVYELVLLLSLCVTSGLCTTDSELCFRMEQSVIKVRMPMIPLYAHLGSIRRLLIQLVSVAVA